MEERCRKSEQDDDGETSGRPKSESDDKGEQSTRPDQKRNWFKSLTRRKKGRDDKENINHLNRSASSNDVTNPPSVEQGASNNKDSPTKNTNVFYTLRKRFWKRNKQCQTPEDAANSVYADMTGRHSVIANGVATNNGGGQQSGGSSSGVQGNYYVNTSEMEMEVEKKRAMDEAKDQMSMFGWYWGPLTRTGAQKRLQGKQNGSFLVRDSQTNGYHFTISFKSASCTLHYRIEFVSGHWYIESGEYKSMVDLIMDTIQKSKDNVLCYVKQSNQLQPPFPVRLTNPISRFCEVPPLMILCRFVIQDNISVEQIDKLPLPLKMQNFVREEWWKKNK